MTYTDPYLSVFRRRNVLSKRISRWIVRKNVEYVNIVLDTKRICCDEDVFIFVDTYFNIVVYFKCYDTEK
jgi:hypothetical protein